MYITAVPNRHSPPAILLRESFRDGDKVRTRTLAKPDLLGAGAHRGPPPGLKGESMASRGSCNPSVALSSPCCCAQAAMPSISLLQVLGSDAGPNSSLFLSVARVALRSRLSAVRWAAQHAVAETLGLKRFVG